MRAFSLVELSIVLVILGLLVGGILAGKSLIRASELRAVGTEYQRYLTATHSFRDRYFAFPGDMVNATSFWGTAGTCPGTQATARTTAATCNGDGNGLLGRAVATSNEVFGFWQHLANAGLIEGSYAGVSNDATASDLMHAADFNLPGSKLDGAVWMAYNSGITGISDVNLVEGNYTNVFWFGAPGTTAVQLNWTAIITPEEAWNIDTKMDDGQPGAGLVVTMEGQPTCYLLADGSAGAASNSVARNDTQYNLSAKTKSCLLAFRRYK